MNVGRLIVGIVVLALGVVFLLDRLNVVSAGVVIGGYWPLVIVAAGLLQLASAPRAWVGAAVTMLVGLALLAATLNLLPANSWQLIWPVALIVVGLLFLLGYRTFAGPGRSDARDAVGSVAFFSGGRIVNQSQAFRGGSLTSIFGGLTVDLRQARPVPGGATIDATVAFGGVDIVVPDGWTVTLSGVPIFGGFDDKRAHAAPGAPDGPHLRVRGTALFGGVNVKDRD